MERRTALKLIAAGVIAERLEGAHQHLVQIAQAPAAYKLQFFSQAQNELLDKLSDLIIPADDHSPGAHEAKVSLFTDLMVANSQKDAQQQWGSGLKAVEAEAQRRFQKPFLKLSAAEQDQIMAAMAANEGKPSTELERFFARLKSMTIDGYYTSEIGIHKDLQYKGNTALAEFPGCTHPEHQA
ncbi:MAG: gluconate 2-dehydrogenase subunit 3 family protein [Acidobacteria bacterium]|nr:gluconate 2-dehydrogenase subunit 3 family protein [Acidobacteriota bacterium]